MYFYTVHEIENKSYATAQFLQTSFSEPNSLIRWFRWWACLYKCHVGHKICTPPVETAVLTYPNFLCTPRFHFFFQCNNCNSTDIRQDLLQHSPQLLLENSWESVLKASPDKQIFWGLCCHPLSPPALSLLFIFCCLWDGWLLSVYYCCFSTDFLKCQVNLIWSSGP